MIRNVIVVNDHCVINGGQAKVAITSAVGLAHAGMNVVFFAGQGPIDPSLPKAGVRVVCLDQLDILSDPSRLKAMARGVWNTRAARALRTLLGEFDPADTIVHCHGFAKVLSASIGPVITGHPIPHVYTMHEYFLACPNGGFFHYPDNEICTRRALGPSCLTTNCDPRQAAHKAWRVARQMAVNGPGNLPKGLRHVIYISGTQRSVMEPYLAGGTNLHHIPNPVDVVRASPVNVADNDLFVFIGRLSPEKGAAMFAEAAALAGAKAVFVGDGEARKDILQSLPDAQITGWQTPAQVSDWISKARCVVFPSLWYECQPLVPYEALARGVPVITGQWGAASEAVTDMQDGILVERPTAADFAAALAVVDRETASRMGEAAMAAYWTNPLTVERHCDTLLSIYRGIDENRNAFEGNDGTRPSLSVGV